MASNALTNIFGIGKNASRAFLRTFYYAAFNSKHISSDKHFSKMLLKAVNGPQIVQIDRAAIIIFFYNISTSIFLSSDARARPLPNNFYPILMTSRNFYPILMTSHNFAVSNISENSIVIGFSRCSKTPRY